MTLLLGTLGALFITVGITLLSGIGSPVLRLDHAKREAAIWQTSFGQPTDCTVTFTADEVRHVGVLRRRIEQPATIEFSSAAWSEYEIFFQLADGKLAPSGYCCGELGEAATATAAVAGCLGVSSSPEAFDSAGQPFS